ncbi:UNVERIFIED_CONTAM: hypothetical protein LK11_05865 [Mumia flava]
MATLPPRRTSRFRLTGLVFVYVALGLPTMVVAILVTVAIPLAAIGIGFGFLVVLVPVLRRLAGAHRWIAGAVLRTPVPDPYRVRTERGAAAMVRSWANDPARWRDLAWAYVATTLSFLVSLVPLVLLLGVVWFLVFPFVYAVTPDGVFDLDAGVVQIDSAGSAMQAWIPAGLLMIVWWFTTPPVARLRARMDVALLAPTRGELERRLAHVEASRAETIDHSAAEIRRIERDLHDGAQARLASLGMSLGLAEQVFDTDPESARRLIAEARDTTTAALDDLRGVVRGIHPPVLADRGLGGAVEALALDLAVPVDVRPALPGRLPAPVESALYFGVAEALANVVRHAHASSASVDLTYDAGRVRAVVADNGVGGADAARGTGLAGVARRMDSFDGTMMVESPAGGPTVVTLELPCALSSPRTSPS